MKTRNVGIILSVIGFVGCFVIIFLFRMTQVSYPMIAYWAFGALGIYGFGVAFVSNTADKLLKRKDALLRHFEKKYPDEYRSLRGAALYD